MKISIIIPTLNEAENLPKLLKFLKTNPYKNIEIIIVDAASTDNTLEIAKKFEDVEIISQNTRNRAVQMNLGAKAATGDLLYFVHADVLPPENFAKDIIEAINAGYELGCYRFTFDKKSVMLRFNAWWTRFNFMFCRGGDQTLFVTPSVFEELNRFNESYVIMEDFDFIKRARKKYRFKILPKSVVVSARKYKNNSYFKVNMVNLYSYWRFQFGVSPEKIKSFYQRSLNQW